MNYKRALWLTILLYLTSFIVGLFSASYFGLEYSTTTIPQEVFIFGIFSMVILMIIFTTCYFKGDKVPKATVVHGVQFGFFAIAISFLLDFTFIVPAILSGQEIDIVAYYGHPLFWTMLAAVPITSGVTASYIEKSKMDKKPAKKKTSKKAPAKKKSTKK